MIAHSAPTERLDVVDTELVEITADLVDSTKSDEERFSDAMLRVRVALMEWHSGKAAKTVKNRESDLRMFGLHVTGDPITVEHAGAILASLGRRGAIAAVQGWVDAMLEDGAARSSVARRLSSAKGFLRVMNHHGVDWNLDTLKAPSFSAYGLVEGPSWEKVVGVLQQLKDDAENPSLYATERAIACRDRAMLGLFLHTGIRRQGMADLRWRDVKLERKQIHVLWKGGETLWRPIGDFDHASLAAWRRVSLEFFGAGADSPDRFVRKSFRGASKGRGLDARGVFERVRHHELGSPHKIRHTLLTEYWRRVGNLKKLAKLAGHKRLTTAQSYIDSLGDDDAREATEFMSDVHGLV